MTDSVAGIYPQTKDVSIKIGGSRVSVIGGSFIIETKDGQPAYPSFYGPLTDELKTALITFVLVLLEMEGN